ncbi:MAG TPA: peptidase, partial [Flavobacteriaceae bacterium]|nr:peptidase [Flavobacteriaceae bacterium]
MKKILGRTDKANFPKLGLKEIAIKMDTGAYTSSIHCNNIREENNILKCSFLDEEHPNYDHQLFTFDNYKITTVKSSNGITQKR